MPSYRHLKKRERRATHNVAKCHFFLQELEQELSTDTFSALQIRERQLKRVEKKDGLWFSEVGAVSSSTAS